MDEYILVNGKKFRKGYTTGTCATAVAKAATKMLIEHRKLDSISVLVPAGKNIEIALHDIEVTKDYAVCSCIKDAGDDPDVTHGIKVFAKATRTLTPGVTIKAGIGIGMVTLPGLPVAVGEHAINPVPRRMIADAIIEQLPQGMGVQVEILIPEGVEVAKRTYNPKLGIVDGISILGTTGIVEPMSEEAWKDALAIEITQAKACGHDEVFFVFGNYGEEYVKDKLGISGNKVITISNFVGFMLGKAVEAEIKKITFVGHAGKLVKLAGGIFHTSSRVADARMEIMACMAALEGASQEVVERIYSCVTTDAAFDIIAKNNLSGVYKRIVDSAKRKSEQYVYDKIAIDVVMFNGKRELLARTE